MMTIKSLPSTYNKDLQNDKECMLKNYDKLRAILNVAAGTLESLKVSIFWLHKNTIIPTLLALHHLL